VAPSATAAPSGSSAALTKITVSSAAVTAGSSPVWVAKEAGIFAKHGLDVDITAIAGASTTISALLAGDIQIINAGAPEALSAIAGGTDLVFLGVMEPVYSFLLEVGPAIQTPADLKGKTLAIVATGATVDIATRVGVRKLGLEPDKDVHITPLGTQSASLAAILSGKVDGGVLTLSDALQAEAKGFHPLLNLAEAKLATANSAIYTQHSYVTAHHDVVQGYIDGIVEGTARLKRDKPFAINLFKKYLKLEDEKTLNAVYDFYSQAVLPSLPYIKPEDFTDAVAVLSQKNPKVADVDWSTYIDSSFVHSAADRHLDQG
ncbi:MAG TPA: ABC transporter substrate-binding protein, partial [Chloroflexota bacterium]